MRKLKKLLKTGRMAGAAFAAALTGAIILALTGCPGTDEGGGGGISDPKLSYETVSRLAYMGGSLMYNPDTTVAGQLAEGVTVATRFTRVRLDASASADANYQETANAFGYLTVTSVSAASVTVAYTEFDDEGTAVSKGLHTVGLDAAVDITGDGMPDLTYAPPAYKRDGMENAVWLTFISRQPADGAEGNIGMYSVLADQYARSALPNGVMGITPDGRFVISKYESGGARAAVRGAEYGDIVVDGVSGVYANIKDGSKFRGAARSMDDAEADGDLEVVATGEDWTASSDVADGASTVIVAGDPPWFEASQFSEYATPEKLWDALPASLQAGTSGDTVSRLNDILGSSVAEVVDAVIDQMRATESARSANGVRRLRSAREVVDNTWTVDEFAEAAEMLKEEALRFTTMAERVSALRSFLNAAYPDLAPLQSAQSMTEMFPIGATDFSDRNAAEEQVAQIAEAMRAIESASRGNSTARATNEFTDGYNTYLSKKSTVTDTFRKNYTSLGSFTIPMSIFVDTITVKVDNITVGAKIFENASMTIELGLYGSYEAWWGHVQMGTGVVALVTTEIDGLSRAFQVKVSLLEPLLKSLGMEDHFEKDFLVGYLWFTVYVEPDAGVEFNVGVAAPNLFSGMMSLYGVKAYIGANYGINTAYYTIGRSWWAVRIPYPSPYFTPYKRGERVQEVPVSNAYYFGRKKTTDSIPAATGTIMIKPYASLEVSVSLYRVLNAAVGIEAGLPITFQISVVSGGFNAGASIEGVLELYASVGLKVDFNIFTYKQDFGRWTIWKGSTGVKTIGKIY